MIEVVKYSIKYKAVWDDFVKNSKNGTFLLYRDYMEYHADRFIDHSLLYFYKNRLVALLPANEAGPEIHSHGGLSYGGFITGSRMKAALMLQVVQETKSYFAALGFESLKYKAIPHIYHTSPAEEDLYALFRHGAILYRRDLNSVVELSQPLKYSNDRRWRLSQGKRVRLHLGQSENHDKFFELSEQRLKDKYNLYPVHTATEMKQLAALFPGNIRLYAATSSGELVAGALMYETPTVAHAQYLAASEQGRSLHALNVLVDWLLREVYPHKSYFSFGISTEQQSLYLNEGLVQNKESYGARAVVHDFYELKLI